MADLHEKVRSMDTTNHETVKDTLAQFVQKLTKSAITDHFTWLASIEYILTRFPKFCLSYRNVIENYLVQFLDSEHKSVVISAAKCCHALQQIRPPNEKTTNPKFTWKQQMESLCSTAHAVMTAAFTDAVDIFKRSVSTDDHTSSTAMGVALSQLSTGDFNPNNKQNKNLVTLSPAQKNAQLCMRLNNILNFVQAMLVEVYPTAKPIRPQLVLDVIVRALSITSGNKNQPMKETDRQLFNSSISSVKIEAFRTLDALIVCLGANLIPYSPLVFRLVTQTLRWSSENPTEGRMEVRVSCYDTLSMWLGVLRCHKLADETGRGTALDEELVNNTLDDVQPKLVTVQLTMSNQSMKNLRKKARRKMTNTILNQSALASHIPGEKGKQPEAEENPEVVLAALRCLQVLLVTCGAFLKPLTHLKIQDVLVRAGYKLTQGCDASRGLATCRALEASRVCVPSRVPPPTQHCMQIYSMLANSAHTEISQFCSQALLSVRVSLHGVPPSLNYAAEPRQQRATERPHALVSERNRAALASLLGEDKLPPPPPMPSDEVINLNDSPTWKRRTEDDKISISSQSSIEVQIDESNGMDLDSPESEFGEPINDETDNGPGSFSNGKMRLIDFDKKKLDAIHEYETQMPVHSSTETLLLTDSNHSAEVSYDHNDTKDEDVNFIANEGDALPSTNETDDVAITCGQTAKSSQDSAKSLEEKRIIIDVSEPIEVQSSEVIVENREPKIIEIVEVESSDKCDADSSVRQDELNVEAMLADFVDEQS